MSEDRYILVIADNSSEMNIALEYACARSKKTGRKIIIATFVEPIDVLTTQGVSEIMKNEARDEAEKRLKEAASFVKNKTGEIPILSVREGETISELKKLIDEEKNINVLVLASKSDDKSKFDEAIDIAKEADKIVLVMGEDYHMSGEAASRTNINIPGVQTELIKALRQALPRKKI